MLKLDIKSDGSLNSSVKFNGEILPAQKATIHLSAECDPIATVVLTSVALDIKQINSELYVFLGTKQMRLVDEDEFVVAKKPANGES